MRIVLISCSNLKRPFSDPTPAEDVYDGPYYRTIRKLKREERYPKDVRIMIVSAEHGLLGLDDKIVPYDRKITKERCKELQAATIMELVRTVRSVDCYELVINLGPNYLNMIYGLEAKMPQTCSIKYLHGTIIQRRKQLKEYLLYGGKTLLQN